MMETRKSIDDCSGEEWSAATRAFWERMDEDPQYQKQHELFDGTIFDKADETEEDPFDFNASEAYEGTYQMLEEEKQFEQIVQVLGPYGTISYCHGVALEILLNLDTCLNNSQAIRKASRALDRMARLTDETRGVNW